ncbi:uncharacterized protein BP01DRAFT_384168 [Aspergillus saccharolyticus JOP 1030-1]|uniref:Uncharacterized protein n=1 Tax=Aspergillus saccharolyticus JOP 1030-1 TaxID=1450539 RepID=A0A319A9W5_9EURO|nr:hypothetical protein BP01DRAFT_384168 [Aspergillus saccharolyticus JOP 1030-1]PYH43782.1 hypothetical protein BP01DRAFT_384168 [Aspergillus saccharolyticus JOP 1030-1]
MEKRPERCWRLRDAQVIRTVSTPFVLQDLRSPTRSSISFLHRSVSSFRTVLPTMSRLLEPSAVAGKLPLRDCVVMGSMTRNRCVNKGTFVELDWLHLAMVVLHD